MITSSNNIGNTNNNNNTTIVKNKINSNKSMMPTSSAVANTSTLRFFSSHTHWLYCPQMISLAGWMLFMYVSMNGFFVALVALAEAVEL